MKKTYETINKEDIDNIYGEKIPENKEEIIADAITLEFNRHEQTLIQKHHQDDQLFFLLKGEYYAEE